MSHSVVVLNPFVCIWRGFTTATGLQSSVVAFLCMLLLGMLIIWRGKEKDISETDERNFDYSVKGTYGTAGYMKPEEQKDFKRRPELTRRSGDYFWKGFRKWRIRKPSDRFQTE